MSTRSTTHFIDSEFSTKPIAIVYRHSDGYPEGAGMDIARFLKLCKKLPDTWNGFAVIDGDTHDLRFLDQHRLGLVIGLHAKGRAKRDTSGFVQITGAL